MGEVYMGRFMLLFGARIYVQATVQGLKDVSYVIMMFQPSVIMSVSCQWEGKGNATRADATDHSERNASLSINPPEMEGMGLAISNTHYQHSLHYYRHDYQDCPVHTPSLGGSLQVVQLWQGGYWHRPGQSILVRLCRNSKFALRGPDSPRRCSRTFPNPIPFQYDALLFRNVNISPEQQYALTKVQYLHMSTEPHQALLRISRADTHPSFHRIP